MAGGRLCDVFEQKVMLLAGMTIFNTSTLMCALAQNQITLIIGRGIQGTWPFLPLVVPSYSCNKPTI